MRWNVHRSPRSPARRSEGRGRVRRGDEQLLAGPPVPHPGEGGVLERRVSMALAEADIEDGEHADLGLAQAEYVSAPITLGAGSALRCESPLVLPSRVRRGRRGLRTGQLRRDTCTPHVSQLQSRPTSSVSTSPTRTGLAWLADLDDGVSQVTASPLRSSRWTAQTGPFDPLPSGRGKGEGRASRGRSVSRRATHTATLSGRDSRVPALRGSVDDGSSASQAAGRVSGRFGT